MIPTHVERKSVRIYSQVTSTTVSEIASMIEVNLYGQLELDMTNHLDLEGQGAA